LVPGVQVVVRAAAVADAAAIDRVHVLAWQAAYPGPMPPDYLDGLDVDRPPHRTLSRAAAPPVATSRTPVRDHAPPGQMCTVPSDRSRTGARGGVLIES
jgi:hypothetical protein